MDTILKVFRAVMILTMLVGTVGSAPAQIRARAADAPASQAQTPADLLALVLEQAALGQQSALLGELPQQAAGPLQVAAPFQTERTVYDDALASGWENWSYSSTVNFANASPTLTGQASIAVTFNAPYAGFSVRTSPPLPAADFSAISFFVYAPNTDRALSLAVQTADEGGLSELFYFNAPADTWSQIVVGLDSLGDPGAIARINIGDNSGSAQPVFYLDQITLLASGSTAGQDIPAVIPGALQPTLSVSPQNGYAGQPLTASGQAPAGLGANSGVRLAWLFDGATFNAKEVLLSSSASFSASLEVPLGAPPGPARLCAALTGLANAAFTCRDFTIDPPPPAEVGGQLAADLVAPGKQAYVELLDPGGATLHRAAVASNGSFSLGKVPPGWYAYTVVGQISKPAKPGYLELKPGLITTIPISRFLPGSTVDPVTDQYCLPEDNLFTVSPLSADITDRGPSVGQSSLAEVDEQANLFSDRFAKANTELKLKFREDFGTYVSGVTLNNTFRSRLQDSSGDSGAVLVEVQYHIVRAGQQPVSIGSPSAAPYAVSYNVGSLPPGKHTLVAAPIVRVEGQNVRQCPTMRQITVVADPSKSGHLREASTVWTGSFYRFQGILPNVPGLPLRHPPGPTVLPYLGNVQSELSAGIQLRGVMQLNNVMKLELAMASARAVVFGRTLYSQNVDLTPAKTTFYPRSDAKQPAIHYSRSLWSDRYDQTVFSAVLFSFLGIVNVGMTVKIGMSGDLVLTAIIYPFEPAADLTLQPQVAVDLTVSVWVNILVLASAGADAIPSVHLAIPLRIKTNQGVWLDRPCYGVRVDVRVWVQVNYIFDKWRKSHTFNVLRTDDPRGCIFTAQVAAEMAEQLLLQAEANLQAAPPEPRLMASPHVAAGPFGRLLSVYVDDLTPNAENPTPAVMARFKEPNSENWLPAVQLSSGQRAVNDPTAVFFGDDGDLAMVAWTQTDITPEQEAAAETLDEIMNRMEIYARRWDGDQWLPAERLTNDQLGDGMPSLAGDYYGAHLAWTRDSDGDSSTQADMVIALRSWGTESEAWSGLETFKAAPSGMNALVSASSADYDEAAVLALGWVYDADGSPDTLEDRRLQLAVKGPPNYDWVLLNPQPLPPRTASVSLALDPSFPSLLNIAFAAYNLAGDEQTAGAVSDDQTIYAGYLDWQNPDDHYFEAVADERGQPVRGERPRIFPNRFGDMALTFRRFGEFGTTGQLGQVAFSRETVNQQSLYSPPVYLTGGLNQHWQAAANINWQNNRLELLVVQRPPLNPAALQALGAFDPGAAALPAEARPGAAQLSQEALRAAAGKVALLRSLAVEPAAAPLSSASVLSISSGDPLISLTFANQADPALDPQLELSKQHALPGSTVSAAATLRNLGRLAASGELRFYRGLPGGSSLLETVPVELLDSGEVRQISHTYTVQGGEEPIYAEFVPGPSSTDSNPNNNLAAAKLGALPAPQIGVVRRSLVFEDAHEITILPTEAEGVSGHRVLRSLTPGGPYELVGETTGDLHYDLLLQAGKTYCYLVQAYDLNGLTSPYSQEVCTLLPLDGIYLPLIGR